MPHIPDGSVNLICTDLPYGSTFHAWDFAIPLEPMWKEFYRMLAHNGAIVLFASQPLTSLLVASNVERYKHSWIWDKISTGSCLHARKGPLKTHEDVLVFGHKAGGTVYNPQMSERDKPVKYWINGNKRHAGTVVRIEKGIKTYTHRFPISIQRFSKRKEPDGWLHPSQKPIDLVRYLVRTYSDVGDTVLDCCCGSGTTGVACIIENRHYILADVEKKFVRLAEQRLNKHKAAQALASGPTV
jgi:site-specific DNA-methyltransferase (adenine-specific)